MCVNLPNQYVNFIFLHKFGKETHCFLKKITQLEKIYMAAVRNGRDKFQVCASMHGANLSSGLRQLSGEAIVAG